MIKEKLHAPTHVDEELTPITFKLGKCGNEEKGEIIVNKILSAVGIVKNIIIFHMNCIYYKQGNRKNI